MTEPLPDSVVVVPPLPDKPGKGIRRADDACRLDDTRAIPHNTLSLSSPDGSPAISRAAHEAMQRWGIPIQEPELGDDDSTGENPAIRIADGFRHLNVIKHQPPSGNAVLADYRAGYQQMRANHNALLCMSVYGFGILGLFVAAIATIIRDSSIRPGRFAGLLATIIVALVGLLIAHVI